MSLSLQPSRVALYLGETYGHLGVFNKESKKILDRAFYLPQTSLKTVFQQVVTELQNQNLIATDLYIVTKYFDRLKSFRLGGSVAQLVDIEKQNSYSIVDDKHLSLAAASLIITLSTEKCSLDYLQSEIDRIKKINPDVNKIVISVDQLNKYQLSKEQIHQIFEKNNFKIFTTPKPLNFENIRLTLLQSGTEGTREELIDELKQSLGEKCNIHFWSGTQFKTNFSNDELFNSVNSFLSYQCNQNKTPSLAYFDLESFRLVHQTIDTCWNSPWGTIPTNYSREELFKFQPLTEIKMNDQSLIQPSDKTIQHEPGPVLAGRSIRPLLIDLFYDQLVEIPFMNSLFPQMKSETQSKKVLGQISILLKAQTLNSLTCTQDDIKNAARDHVNLILTNLQKNSRMTWLGPLAGLFNPKAANFNWPDVIQKEIPQ